MADYHVAKEILPLADDDSFVISHHVSDTFSYPVHFHSEYEITLILNGRGLKRTVGTGTEVTDDAELILLGPNLQHGWETFNCRTKAEIITIQFQKMFFSKLLQAGKIGQPVIDLLEQARYGTSFSAKTAEKISIKLLKLRKLNSKKCRKEVISILSYMAKSSGIWHLSQQPGVHDNEKLALIQQYITQNFHTKITLEDVCAVVDISQVSFNRFIKKHTGRTFINYLNATRVSFAARWLSETDLSVGDIAAKSGFNNLANFNRTFKSLSGMAPVKYRQQYYGTSRVV